MPFWVKTLGFCVTSAGNEAKREGSVRCRRGRERILGLGLGDRSQFIREVLQSTRLTHLMVHFPVSGILIVIRLRHKCVFSVARKVLRLLSMRFD